jgi:hypothetical protein
VDRRRTTRLLAVPAAATGAAAVLATAVVVWKPVPNDGDVRQAIPAGGAPAPAANWPYPSAPPRGTAERTGLVVGGRELVLGIHTPPTVLAAWLDPASDRYASGGYPRGTDLAGDRDTVTD